MSTANIFLMAAGLAMDAFAVSITSGIAIKHLRVGHAFRIALFFGGFQAVMPVIGWQAGLALRDIISSYDHWIAFCLLTFVGGKMIYEATFMDKKEGGRDPLNIYVLLVLSIATSIDALAVGLTLSLLAVDIAVPAIIIGFVTFILSFMGVFVGDRLGHFFESRIEAAGGVILIGIGLKILAEHLA